MTTTAPPALTSDQLAEVLANIELGTARWRRKLRIVAVVGRWGRVHEVSQRQLEDRCSVSRNLLIELLEELVRARILVCWYAPEGGTRAAAYTVNPNIDQWGRDRAGALVDGGVPWLRDVAAVRLWVFHVEPEQYAEPGQRREGGAYSRRRPAQRREGGAYSRRSPEQRREGGSDARRRGISAARGETVFATQEQPDPQEVPTWVGSSGTSPPPEGSGGESIDGPEWRRARAAVLAAADNGGRAKFLNGPPERKLLEVVASHGTEQVIAWLVESPAGLGVPRLVDWLADRSHQPDPELVEQLANRAEAEVIASGDLGATGGGMHGWAAPPEVPRLREFTGHAYDGEPVSPAVAAARAALRTPAGVPADDTMSTGGAHP
jgi:hypothetical protein